MVKVLTFLYRAVAIVLAGFYFIGLPVKIKGRPLGDKITVTAHAGCMELPMNSVEAMEAGVAAGADIVEFDLQYTADGTPVLSHDRPAEDAVCVTVAEAFAFLAAHPGVRANVDVKSTEYLEKIPALAAEAGVTDRIFLTGLREHDIETAREKCPGIPYYLNAGVSEDDDFAALAKKTARLGAIGVNLYWEDANPKLASVFHKAGLLVSVWTVDTVNIALFMALTGADNITTNRPDLVSALIR